MLVSQGDVYLLEALIFKENQFIHSMNIMLHKLFGYTEFRLGQEEIITHIMNGRDVLGIMPTGAGKSICYQLSAIISKGLTVVVSPLLSLMYDQVKDLEAIGILAHKYSGASLTSIQEILRDFESGKCHILYTTPETLTTNTSFLMELENLYKDTKLARFIVDEAHCVSSWGHDFRPAYLSLYMKSWFPGVQICAFTATATKLVTQDIIDNLSLENPYLYRSSFIKSNIRYQIRLKDKDSWTYLGNSVYKYIREMNYCNATGIIYCLSRRECEYMAQVLKNKGLKAKYYHALVPTDQKEHIQNSWLSGETKIIVATIAFALGINKPDVRYILHTSMPKSIESYYQQTGRAGRDGKPAHCVMYYSSKDRDILMKMATDESTDMDLIPPVRNTDRISDIYNMCRNTVDCIKFQMSNYLGENFIRTRCLTDKEMLCYNCITAQKKVDVTDQANKMLNIIDNQELSTFKRTTTLLERRILMYLLNNGNVISEVETSVPKLEKLTTIMDVSELKI